MRPEVVRLARSVRWAALVGCIIATCVALGLWLSLAALDPIVRGEGPAGQGVVVTGPAPAGDTDLTVLGRGEPTDEGFECTGPDSQLAVVEELSTKRVEVRGERLVVIGETASAWRPGDVVAPCTGVGLESVVLLEDPRPPRRILALGMGFGAVFLAAWTAVLFALGRSTPRATGPVIEDRRNPYHGNNPY